ncbi:MAG: PhzF family phenazine biosynthesis protein [Eubacteriaceae bacterium]|nr:PhzF family phenazine biosynthesis protein [Eubacteriaceae bacterium]
MKYLVVDAFTETIFGGNPAGVVVLPEGTDFPELDVMIKTAAELRYSETAFIKQLGENEFKIRYCTPAAEVDLCGHATIASFVALLHLGKISKDCVCINHTLAGDLNIQLIDGFVMMDMATPVEIATINEIPDITELYDVMGAEYDPAKISLLPKLVSTGLPDIMMPVATREDLDAIAPNMKALSALSKRYEVTGVHAFTLDTEEGVTAHVRNFAPLYDIDEEAATGTANAALTYYLYLNGLIDGQSKCKIRQGDKMDRPSVILTEINATEDACLIKVGGTAVIVAEGEINI